MIRNMPLLAVAATAALCLAGDAGAQTAPAPTAELDTVTVVAPRITYERNYRPGAGAPRQVRVTQQTAEVDASDLDLGRIADMETLKSRIGAAAKRVCGELTEMHPLGEPDTDVCIRRASDDALAQVDRAMGRVARK